MSNEFSIDVPDFVQTDAFDSMQVCAVGTQCALHLDDLLVNKATMYKPFNGLRTPFDINIETKQHLTEIALVFVPIKIAHIQINAKC